MKKAKYKSQQSLLHQVVEEEANVKIIHLTTRNWKQKLNKALSPEFNAYPFGGKVDPLEATIDIARESCAATTAVVEPYRSYDWEEEYSVHYSRVFRNIPRITQRIHFFGKESSKIKYENLYNMPSALKQAYLGYVVVRPLSAFRVKEAILPLHPLMTSVSCSEMFKVSFLGNVLQVKGVPFCQQDTTVGTCAHANLWMVMRHLQNLGRIRYYSLPEISSLAEKQGPPLPARIGLSDTQIGATLYAMGLHPDILYPYSAKHDIDFISAYVSSGIPVIACVRDHCCLIVGYDCNLTKIQKDSNIKSIAETVEAFIIHDDVKGPYRLTKIELLSSDDGPSPRLMIGGNPIECILSPLPPNMSLTFDDVNVLAETWKESICDYVSTFMDISKSNFWQNKDIKDLVERIYFKSSQKFKENLATKPQFALRNKEIIARLRCMPMPEYIWIVELAKRSDLKGKHMHNRVIRGEMIFDSTCNRYLADEALIAFYLDGIFFESRSGGKSSIVHVVNQKPYSPS